MGGGEYVWSQGDKDSSVPQRPEDEFDASISSTQCPPQLRVEVPYDYEQDKDTTTLKLPSTAVVDGHNARLVMGVFEGLLHAPSAIV